MDSRGPLRTARDGGEVRRDYGGRPGTARVMSHDVKIIRLWVYDFSLASTGGPSPGTIAPYSLSSPHLPRRNPS